jgi:hypothetical protein
MLVGDPHDHARGIGDGQGLLHRCGRICVRRRRMIASSSECEPYTQRAGTTAVHGSTLREDITTGQLANWRLHSKSPVAGEGEWNRDFSPTGGLAHVFGRGQHN